MAIFTQLGLNESFFFQFVIFAIAYYVLNIVVYKPYLKAFEAREERTKGGEDLALEFTKKAEDLRSQYETKARAVNTEIKGIFDQYRGQATKEYDTIVASTRASAQKVVDETRSKVAGEISTAAKQLKSEVPAIAAAITNKLLKN